MGLVIRESKKAFATHQEPAFPCAPAPSWNTHGQRRRRRRHWVRLLLTVMQNSPSPNLHGEQEGKKPHNLTTLLANHRHHRWCPALSSFLLILIPFQAAPLGRGACWLCYLQKWSSMGAPGTGESCRKGRDVKI